MTSYNHLMIDLETMGTGPRSPVMGVGAVPFSIERGRAGLAPKETWFHGRTTLSANMEIGRALDANTIEWWLQQGEAARLALVAGTRFHQVHGMLMSLVDHVNVRARTSGCMFVRLWGKGPDFDIALIRSVFADCGLDYPFKYNAARDVRTMTELAQELELPRAIWDARAEVEHDPLEDAAAQARSVVAIYVALHERTTL